MVNVLTKEEALRIVNASRDATDARADAALANVTGLAEAIEATRETGGRAAIEIGVRDGGTSAMFCAVADRTAPDEFVVISVDPYGSLPFYNPHLDKGLGYGEDHYMNAKRNLASHRRSIFFRMEADQFLATVLPVYTWWLGGRRYPVTRRFVAYVFVDGQHDPTHVVREVAALVPHMAPGGRIVVDNAECVPSAVDMIARSAALGLSADPLWALPNEPLRRQTFWVP